jgi:hypothetical protein
VFLKDGENKPVLKNCHETDVIQKTHSNESMPHFMSLGCAAMIDIDVMVLQNHTNSAMELWDRYGEQIPISGDASQAINIKVRKSQM